MCWVHICSTVLSLQRRSDVFVIKQGRNEAPLAESSRFLPRSLGQKRASSIRSTGLTCFV